MSVNTEPAWYQKWLRKEVDKPVPILTTSPEHNTVTFTCNGTEMLEVSEDGFYVRGVKVAVDDKEALEVYNAFKEWLAWSTLNR